MNQEQKVIIDDKEYLVSDLSEQAVSQINNLKVTDQEISRQESLLAMLKTARSAYARLLGEAIKDAEKNVKAKPVTKNETKETPKVNGKAAAKPAAKAKK